MIKKTEAGYVMDEVKRQTVTTYDLADSDRLILRVAGDNFIRRLCGNCGIYERPNAYSVQAFSPDDGEAKMGVWICSGCAEKLTPDLHVEAEKRSAEWEEEHYGSLDDPRDKAQKPDKTESEKPASEPGEDFPF